jgi:nitroimidazol reductase NimA-like FMN-containing flavoprotein (pyridoxamine 5'-phosphate oxidase superfamily)
MVIREMSREECLRVLAGTRQARLACAHENQPYVVPVSLAYHEAPGGACLYGFTTPGLKVEWMRANPLVCIEVDELVAYDQWVSVIALGRYEELPGAESGKPPAGQQEEEGCDDERVRAWQTLNAPRAVHGAGRQEEEGCEEERARAWQVLKNQPMWWEPGWTVWVARAGRDPAEPYIPLYYRIRIGRVTGHEATPDAPAASSSAATAPPAQRLGWLRGALTRVFGGRAK